MALPLLLGKAIKLLFIFYILFLFVGFFSFFFWGGGSLSPFISFWLHLFQLFLIYVYVYIYFYVFFPRIAFTSLHVLLYLQDTSMYVFNFLITF